MPSAPSAPAAPAAGGVPPTTPALDAALTSKPKPKKSPLRFLVPLAFLAGFAALGYFGYQSMSADTTEPDAVPPTVAADPVTDPAAETATDVAAPADETSSPIVQPLDDANEVVDAINDNAAEDEAIEMIESSGPRGEAPVTAVPFEPEVDLGVGGSAELIAGDIVADDLASVIGAPAFSYRVARGVDAPAHDVFVDIRTGDRELFDGVTYVRATTGEVFSTNDPTGEWVRNPAATPTDPLLLRSALVTIDDVLPEGFVDAATIVALTDETGYGRYAFTETDLAGLPAETRAAWFASFGFDPAQPPTASDAFLDEVPAQARTGEVVVSISGASDGTVTSLMIDAPSLGGLVSYELLGASLAPVDIPVPAVAS